MRTPAQEEDEGFLTRLIQDQLSDAGRAVDITGFRGALSSRATLDRLTIADDDGIWLDLRDAVLDWNRTALLRGRLEVNSLTAGSIEVLRAPKSDDTPAPEASGFSIPELPVSVNIGEIRADRVTLGDSFLGETVELRLSGSAALEGGGMDVDLDVVRTDKDGRFVLDAAYDPAAETLAVNLDLTEPEQGLAAKLMGLPGLPSVELTVAGTGPLDDYRADINLDTDGAPRLDGSVTLAAVETGGRRFTADLGGDVTALIAPDYRDFFGTDVALVASGLRGDDGAISLDAFQLDSAAMRLNGTAELGADGLPRKFDVTGDISREDGTPVILPFGSDIAVARTDLEATFDAEAGDAMTGAFTIANFTMPGYSAGSLQLIMDGSIRLNGTTAVAADVSFTAFGVDAEDEAVAQAIGEEITGSTRIDWTSGQPLMVRDLTVDGVSYGATLDAAFETADGTSILRAEGRAEARDLAAFAPLTGTDLRGAADLAIDVNADLLGGSFRIVAEGGTEGLALGIDQVDPLLAPPATLRLDAERGTGGLTLTTFEIRNEELEASASGTLASESGTISYSARLANAGIFTGADSGPFAVAGTLEQREDGLHVTATGGGDNLALGIAPVDRLLEGGLTLDLALVAGERILLEKANILSEEAEIRADGELTAGARGVDVALLLKNSALFTGGTAGPLSLDLRAEEQGDYWQVTATGGGRDIGIGNDTIDPLFAGSTEVDVAALIGTRLLLQKAEISNPQLNLSARGELTEGARAIDATGRLENSAIFTGGTAGPLDLVARVTQEGQDVLVNLTGTGQDLGIGNDTVDPLLRGETNLRVALVAGERILLREARVTNGQLEVSASGELTEGARAIDATGRLENTAIFTGGRAGALELKATARQDGTAYVVSLDGAGQDIGIGTPAVDDLLRGRSAVALRARIDGSNVVLQQFAFDGTAIDASASGAVAGETVDLALNARLDNIARLTNGLSGPLLVQGTVGQQNGETRLNLRADGPGDSTVGVTGLVGLPGGRVALDIDGQAPLALANAFIAPQSLAGFAGFDLRLDGVPGPEALSGRVEIRDARLVIPEAQQIIENINGTIAMSASRAELTLGADLGGGTIRISGPVRMDAPYEASLVARIANVRVERSGLVSTVLNGEATVSGPLTGAGRITADIGLSDTELRVPSGSLGGLEAIPEITHVAEPSGSRLTRERAGLIGDDAADTDPGRDRSGGGGLNLDIVVRSADSIFVRGRGLDAELRGFIRIQGTTSDPQPTGQFDLVRGRLNVLTKRLDLAEGRLSLAGSFEPTLRLVAENRGSEYTIQVVIDGPASEPTVSFISQPELPEDEVLAQLFFERDLSSLSVLQAAKLAAAVAELTGRGNGGVVSRLRDNFGLDDLDIGTTDEGETSLRVGKYLSDNVYTDAQVLSTGETNLSINLDISQHVTTKGTVSSEGETSLGIFFQKDY